MRIPKFYFFVFDWVAHSAVAARLPEECDPGTPKHQFTGVGAFGRFLG